MFLGLGNGPCVEDPQAACSETDTLAVVPSNDTQLTLTVTAVSYGLLNGQTTSNPTNRTARVVGDSIQLVWQAPGLLEEMQQTGNDYWCGAGVSQSDASQCGA
jgi:hypothetical protein